MTVTTIPGAPRPPRTLAEWLERNEGAAVTARDIEEAIATYPNVGTGDLAAAFAVTNLLGRLRR